MCRWATNNVTQFTGILSGYLLRIWVDSNLRSSVSFVGLRKRTISSKVRDEKTSFQRRILIGEELERNCRNYRNCVVS